MSAASPHLLHFSASALRFIVFGEPKGYRATGGKWNKVTRATLNWYADCVRACESFGVECPLFADKNYPIFIHTRAYYSKGVHCDPGNTHKGLIDALFYKSVGPGDKFVGGSFDGPLYDVSNPRVEVEIRGWVLRKYTDLVSIADTQLGFCNAR